MTISTNAEESPEPQPIDEMAKAAYELWRATQNPDISYLPPWDEMQNPVNRQLWYAIADKVVDIYITALHK